MMIAATQTSGREFEKARFPLDEVDYRLAESEREKDEIYRLRYRAYMREGAIEARGDQRLKDRFDDMPNSWTFGVYIGGVLRSSIRISIAAAPGDDTPAVDAFPDLLKPELAKGKVICDANRFVADPDRENRMPELPYVTVRLGYMACAYFNANIGTATVRAEHRAFYRRVFLVKPLCEPRPYPTLTKPLCLMAEDCDVVRYRIFERYPFFRSSLFERRKLFERTHYPSEPLAPVNLPEFPFQKATIASQS